MSFCRDEGLGQEAKLDSVLRISISSVYRPAAGVGVALGGCRLCLTGNQFDSHTAQRIF